MSLTLSTPCLSTKILYCRDGNNFHGEVKSDVLSTGRLVFVDNDESSSSLDDEQVPSREALIRANFRVKFAEKDSAKRGTTEDVFVVTSGHRKASSAYTKKDRPCGYEIDQGHDASSRDASSMQSRQES